MMLMEKISSLLLQFVDDGDKDKVNFEKILDDAADFVIDKLSKIELMGLNNIDAQLKYLINIWGDTIKCEMEEMFNPIEQEKLSAKRIFLGLYIAQDFTKGIQAMNEKYNSVLGYLEMIKGCEFSYVDKDSIHEQVFGQVYKEYFMFLYRLGAFEINNKYNKYNLRR